MTGVPMLSVSDAVHHGGVCNLDNIIHEQSQTEDLKYEQLHVAVHDMCSYICCLPQHVVHQPVDVCSLNNIIHEQSQSEDLQYDQLHVAEHDVCSHVVRPSMSSTREVCVAWTQKGVGMIRQPTQQGSSTKHQGSCCSLQAPVVELRQNTPSSIHRCLTPTCNTFACYMGGVIRSTCGVVAVLALAYPY